MGSQDIQQGDDLLPDVKRPGQEDCEIGIWGECLRQFHKAHRRSWCHNLLAKRERCPCVVEVKTQTVQMEETLVSQLAAQRVCFQTIQNSPSDGMDQKEEQHPSESKQN